MIECQDCHRHHFAQDAVCPFCKLRRRRIEKARNVALLVLTPIVLAACYGGAPNDTNDSSDLDDSAGLMDVDGDGFIGDEDRDDRNAKVH